MLLGYKKQKNKHIILLGTLLISNFFFRILPIILILQEVKLYSKCIQYLFNYVFYYSYSQMKLKLIPYIDLIYSTTMQICKLNQSHLLVTPFYVHRVQFISSCVLHLPHMTSFVNQFFYSRTEAHEEHEIVPTQKVCRSGQCIYSVYYLLVISRNHSNTFLLIDLQKTKLFQNKILKKGLFFPDIRILTDFDKFLSTT